MRGRPSLADTMAMLDAARPRTRADCETSPRPCPWVGCKYHLLWEMPSTLLYIPYEYWVNHRHLGRLRTDDEIINLLFNMKETCTLDVAMTDNTLETVGEILRVTRERIRQIQDYKALAKLKNYRKSRLLKEYYEP